MQRERTRGVTRRRRKSKAIRRDRPPFEPLTPKDAQRIADKGGLDCADDRAFYSELEELRDCYRARYRWREIAPTGQLRAEIRDALNHLARLNAFFSNGTVVVASYALFWLREREQLGEVPDPVHRNRMMPLAKQRDALRYLEGWVRLLSDRFERAAAASRPNWIAPPPAAVLGLDELVLGLANLWLTHSGQAGLPLGRNSRWICFLRQCLTTIAQRGVSEDGARKATGRAIEYSASEAYRVSQLGLEN